MHGHMCVGYACVHVHICMDTYVHGCMCIYAWHMHMHVHACAHICMHMNVKGIYENVWCTHLALTLKVDFTLWHALELVSERALRSDDERSQL